MFKVSFFVCNFIEHIVAFYRNCNNSRRPTQRQNLLNTVFQESDGILNRSVYARSDVLTALLLKIQVLWHVTLCCWVCCFKHLKGASPSLSCSPRNLFLDCITKGSIVQCSVKNTFKIHFNIFPSMLSLPSVVFPSGFPLQNPVSPPCMPHALSITLLTF